MKGFPKTPVPEFYIDDLKRQLEKKNELLGWVKSIIYDYADKPALGFKAIAILIRGQKGGNQYGGKKKA